MTWAPCPHGVRTRGKKKDFDCSGGRLPHCPPKSVDQWIGVRDTGRCQSVATAVKLVQ